MLKDLAISVENPSTSTPVWERAVPAPGPAKRFAPGSRRFRDISWRDGNGRARWVPPAFPRPSDDTGTWLGNLFVRRGVLSMAPFTRTEITEEELDSLAAYLTR